MSFIALHYQTTPFISIMMLRLVQQARRIYIVSSGMSRLSCRSSACPDLRLTSAQAVGSRRPAANASAAWRPVPAGLRGQLLSDRSARPRQHLHLGGVQAVRLPKVKTLGSRLLCPRPKSRRKVRLTLRLAQFPTPTPCPDAVAGLRTPADHSWSPAVHCLLAWSAI
jgi:hypothetical protein